MTPVEQEVINRELPQIGTMLSPTGNLLQIIPASSLHSMGLTQYWEQRFHRRLLPKALPLELAANCRR